MRGQSFECSVAQNTPLSLRSAPQPGHISGGVLLGCDFLSRFGFSSFAINRSPLPIEVGCIERGSDGEANFAVFRVADAVSPGVDEEHAILVVVIY